MESKASPHPYLTRHCASEPELTAAAATVTAGDQGMPPVAPQGLAAPLSPKFSFVWSKTGTSSSQQENHGIQMKHKLQRLKSEQRAFLSSGWVFIVGVGNSSSVLGFICERFLSCAPTSVRLMDTGGTSRSQLQPRLGELVKIFDRNFFKWKD